MALIEKIQVRQQLRDNATGEILPPGFPVEDFSTVTWEPYYVPVKSFEYRGFQIISYQEPCRSCDRLDQCARLHGNFQAQDTGDGHDGLQRVWRYGPLDMPAAVYDFRREELSYNYFRLEDCKDAVAEETRVRR